MKMHFDGMLEILRVKMPCIGVTFTFLLFFFGRGHRHRLLNSLGANIFQIEHIVHHHVRFLVT